MYFEIAINSSWIAKKYLKNQIILKNDNQGKARTMSTSLTMSILGDFYGFTELHLGSIWA